MDYKEKYEQALERCRKLYNEAKANEYASDIDDYETIFPELVESEDEKILRSLKAVVKEYDMWTERGLSMNDVLTWLEKQGESTETNPSEFDSQLNRLLKQFESLSNEDLASSLSFYLNVVQNDGTYKEEKRGEQKPNFCHHEVAFSGCSEEYRKAYYDGWNNCNQQHAQLEAEQKSAWSEEDKAILEKCIGAVKVSCYSYSFKSEAENWLKSLRPQSTWKPSDEQMNSLKQAINTFPYETDYLELLYDDLKKLKKE